MTEGLAHSLRKRTGERVTAHLLVPGFTYTGITAGGRTEKPTGAWTPEQVVADELGAHKFHAALINDQRAYYAYQARGRFHELFTNDGSE